MKNLGPYYMTTAIAYASGKPHIGNTYEIILADAIARYKRQMGYDVFFQTGTDEHGQKIEDRADKAGMSPKAFVDQTAGEIKRIWDLMNTSYDKFIRTTDANHEEVIQKIFKKLYDQGDIYKGYYEGMYCQECEAFYTLSQLTEDGKCPVCGEDVHEAREEAYFFKMSKYADRLIEHIETHPEFIQPESRKNEMINNFLKPGLQDLCVSRTSFTWGIPVSFDPKHVTYVWLDALCNYITGIGYDPDGSSEQFAKYWPAHLHLIGKDIIRFHTIYWPIFLMALDLPLPKQIFGHPWLLQAGGKMSKSKGNVIYADDLAELFNVDAVRYFCIHEMPFENDGVISYDLMVERWNSELANTMGNLVNRTIAMSNKYFGGKVQHTGVAGAVDGDLKKVIGETVGKVEAKMDKLRVADSLTEVFNLFKRLNKYIDETEPWKLAKDEAQSGRLSEVLYNLFDGITTGATLLHSYMPETAERILAQINASMIAYDELAHAGNYPSDNQVTSEPEILFRRLTLDEVNEKVEEQKKKAGIAVSREEGSAEESKEEDEEAISYTHKETCTYEDFDKCEFRVGVIRSCEEVKKSKKLLCSQVDLGDRTVQILSGLRPKYTPETMTGKRVMVITNLAPRKMAGLDSEGMILCAEAPDGTLSVMTPDKDVPAGSEIG
jgi:methionyl-tRNA synthetase